MSRSGGGRSLFAAATWQRAVQGVAGPTTSWVAAHQPPEVATPFLLAGAVGLAAGLGAVALTGAVEALTDLFFDRIGGELIALGGSWMVIWIPLLGVVPVVFLIERFAREARGHGVPEVMFAIETRDGRIRPRVPLIKGVASALTIGVGGSVGREGPIVSVGAGMASIVAQLTRQRPEMMRTLVAAGAAAGVAATFNAPIAGVFFALEVILRRFDVRNFTIVVTSAVIANMVAIAFEGDVPGIDLEPHDFESVLEVPFYLLLGAAAAFLGVVYVRVLYSVEDGFAAVRVSPYLRAAAGMLMVGGLGFWHEELFGVGFGAIEQVSIGEITTGTIALLMVLKVLATSITLGSGGSGGVFAPSLFIGTMLGSLMGEGFNSIASGIADPGAFAVVGMAALFASAARAPMTSLFIVFEMTRDYSLILPLMIGVATATVLSQLITRDTIYSIKLGRLGVEIPEERSTLVVDNIPVSEAMRTEVAAVGPAATVQEMVETLGWAPGNVLAVQDANDRFEGLVTSTDITAALIEGRLEVTARELEVTDPFSVYADDSLRAVVSLLAEHGIRQVPVVARWDDRRLLGVVEQHDVIRAIAAYSARIRPRRAPSTVPIRRPVGAAQIEIIVAAASRLAGRSLAEIDVPSHAVVTEVRRGGVVLVPRGDTVLQAGDQLLVLAETNVRYSVERILRAQAAPSDG